MKATGRLATCSFCRDRVDRKYVVDCQRCGRLYCYERPYKVHRLAGGEHEATCGPAASGSGDYLCYECDPGIPSDAVEMLLAELREAGRGRRESRKRIEEGFKNPQGKRRR